MTQSGMETQGGSWRHWEGGLKRCGIGCGWKEITRESLKVWGHRAAISGDRNLPRHVEFGVPNHPCRVASLRLRVWGSGEKDLM